VQLRNSSQQRALARTHKDYQDAAHEQGHFALHIADHRAFCPVEKLPKFITVLQMPSYVAGAKHKVPTSTQSVGQPTKEVMHALQGHDARQSIANVSFSDVVYADKSVSTQGPV
jgi:hypothetical protein